LIELDDFMKMSRDLERFHGIFYKLWEMGKPIFTDTIPTAAVEFDEKGEQINFLFNTEYWNKHTEYEREFVICHECLHVILNHGKRIRDQKKSEADITNVALDIVVNHALINKFGFDRSKISMELVWIDSVFPDKDVPENKSFEFYFNLIKQDCIEINCSSCDNHEGLGKGEWESVTQKAGESLSDQEKNALQSQLAGTEAGDLVLFGDTRTYVPKKKKWETVIKKWSMKYLKQECRDTEQWARLNRRLFALSSELLLPSEMEIEDNFEDEKKIEVHFFQDTSGSCRHLKDRFFRAARSLPENRFDIKLFCFDTTVYETSLESGNLYGFGGTSFRVIESYIQRNTVMQGKPYPFVFVITDGQGDHVSPQFPSKWSWFLSYNYRCYIPSGSNVYNLSDFE
jgi:hypothetical protein